MRKSLISAIAITIALSFAATSYAGPPGGNGGNNGGNANQGQSQANTQGQQQGQGQDQGQLQGQYQGQTAKSKQGQAQSTDNANNSSQDTNVNIAGDAAAKIPVSTAIGGQVGAAGGGNYQCLVPISGGVQAPMVGVAFGSALLDEDCVTFQSIAMTAVLFPTDTELKHAMMCKNDVYKEANADIGRVCPSSSAEPKQVASAKVWNNKPFRGSPK